MRLLAVLMGACATITSVAQDRPEGLSVRGDFSGNWTDPLANRQGVQIEVVDSRRAVIAWFTYDAAGSPVWNFGTGRVEGNTISAELFRFRGGAFPPGDSDPDAIKRETWGQVTLSFDDCNSGTMRWEPVLAGLAPGEMPIVRVTSIEGSRCGQGEGFEQTIQYSLDAGPGRWRAIFADFSENQLEEIDDNVEAEWTELPAPLSDRRGFKLAGTNHSADLAMLLTTPLAGLEPATDYALEFDLTFATRVPRGCIGAGGPPGEGVHIKLGASRLEPMRVRTDDATRRLTLNIDTGEQSNGGADAMVVGDMTNSQDCEAVGGGSGQWELKTVTSRDRSFVAQSDDSGRMWIYALSDSGFEGRTTFFITDVTVRLQAL